MRFKKNQTFIMKRIIFLFALSLATVAMNAQTVEELKAEKAEKEAALSKLQGEVDALQGQIDAFPGWKLGSFGTVGASLSGFDRWYSNAAPSSSAGNIGISVNGFANLDREKFFWKNSGNINLSWVKLDDKNNPLDSPDFNESADVFSLSSLYGRKLNDKWAISGLGEYRTTLINNFNNPGYLDLGTGATWTPLQNLVVVIHPLNYNFIFSKAGSAYQSSLGAKIMADYTRSIGKVNFKTNLSAFQSYKGSNLSNWTWVNSFGYTLWKGIGLGFEFGLRNNKQETLNNALISNSLATFGNINNKLQSYWLFGLNFNL